MFGSLKFLAFLNFLLFSNASLSICPFHINLGWRKGLCGTKARIAESWGCGSLLCSACTWPQPFVHSGSPSSWPIYPSQGNGESFSMSGRVLTPGSCRGTEYSLFARSRMTGVLRVLALLPFPFPLCWAPDTLHCSEHTYFRLGISCCFHWFLPVLEIVNFNSEPCVQSSSSAEIIQDPGRDFFL